LSALPPGEPQAGTVIEPGVYRWEALAYDDYAVGGSGDTPANLSGLLVTDADGEVLQNPALRLEPTSPHAELHYFYFIVEGTPVP
jgi:hypothetical protein